MFTIISIGKKPYRIQPEYNLAAAVSSSGSDGYEQLIAQEIILAVLKEEGLIPDDVTIEMPSQNLERAKIPESIKTYEGIYDSILGLMKIEFTEDSLILTWIDVKNERSQEYIYNTDGEFVSTNGDYIGLSSSIEGVRGVTALKFTGDKYIVVQTYENLPGLSGTATAMPVAEKLEVSLVSDADEEAWKSRNPKEYLLVNEKYTSFAYVHSAIAKILSDDRAHGYVGMGIYRGRGAFIKSAKIVDKDTALGFQDTPTMSGRDTNNLYITNENGVQYLNINNFRYIDATAAKKF